MADDMGTGRQEENSRDSVGRPKNMLESENVVVHHTQPHGGDVPSAGHVHEERDIPIGTLLRATGILLAGIIVVSLAMWGLFQFLAYQADRADPEVSPMVQRTLPPEPRLQSNEPKDLAEFRRREDIDLNASRTDSTGATKIPIEEAMDLIAKNGMPHFVSSIPDSTKGKGKGTAAQPSSVPATSTTPAPGARVSAPPSRR